MSGFRNKFSNFMSGRYGMDEFGRFLNIVIIVMLIISLFGRLFAPLGFLWIVAVGLMIYSYFRMFSRNFAARSKENAWYLRTFKKNSSGSYGYNGYGQNYTANMTASQKKALDKKTHRIFKCPNCSQKIRVPKHKGRICIKCPNCRIEFIKKT